MNTIPIGRRDKIVIQEVNDEMLIYDLKLNRAVCLNKTSAMVWELCDGQKSVSEIAEHLSKKLNKPVTDEFVWFAIEQLNKEGLLESDRKTESPFKGLSRREVIRKVGFASMIALPLVSSIVAPTSAHAQSCVGMGTFAPGADVFSGSPVILNCTSIGTCNLSGGGCCSGMTVHTDGAPPCTSPQGTCVCA